MKQFIAYVRNTKLGQLIVALIQGIVTNFRFAKFMHQSAHKSARYVWDRSSRNLDRARNAERFLERLGGVLGGVLWALILVIYALMIVFWLTGLDSVLSILQVVYTVLLVVAYAIMACFAGMLIAGFIAEHIQRKRSDAVAGAKRHEAQFANRTIEV